MYYAVSSGVKVVFINKIILRVELDYISNIGVYLIIDL